MNTKLSLLLKINIILPLVHGNDQDLIPMSCLTIAEPAERDTGRSLQEETNLNNTEAQEEEYFDLTPFVAEKVHLDMHLFEYNACVTNEEDGSLISIQWTLASELDQTDKLSLPRIGPSENEIDLTEFTCQTKELISNKLEKLRIYKD